MKDQVSKIKDQVFQYNFTVGRKRVFQYFNILYFQ